MNQVPRTIQVPEFDQGVLSLADVYAEGLIEAADAQGQTEQVAAELADLIAYMDQNKDFDAFMTSETVDDEPRRASLEKLFRGRMNDLLLNTLQVLNNRRRSGLVRAMARCVQLRMEARHQQQEITVRSAVPLTDESRRRIQEVASQRIGKEVLLIEELDPTLIGGMVLQINDVQIDASVSNHLLSIWKRLRDRATVEVHQGGRYVVEGQ